MHINTREEMRVYWLSQMKDGRTRFVLQAGILRFGAGMFGMFLVLSILGGRFTILRSILESILFAVIFGTIYGLLTWYFIRRRYGLSF
jgi:hypothetical protein